jgi:hypothetical protein
VPRLIRNLLDTIAADRLTGAILDDRAAELAEKGK